MRKFFSLLFSIFFFVSLNAQNQLIPQPKDKRLIEGVFKIPETILISNELPAEESQYLINRLKNNYKIKMAGNSDAHIIKIKNSKITHPEAYAIEISNSRIQIK